MRKVSVLLHVHRSTAARVRLSLVDYSFALDIASSSSDVIAENEIVFELLAQVLLSTLDSTAPIDLQDQLGVPAEVHLETGGAVVALRPVDVGPANASPSDEPPPARRHPIAHAALASP